jgi:hypothetical protein
MPLRADLELAAITLPLDVVLTTIAAAKGRLDEGAAALLQIEVGCVLAAIPGLEGEVLEAIMRDTFGDS